ncbi:MAG: hypothetical protein FJY65_08885 [Calditrichaeota bacterium]|nr:hypothetical protein [Calditrichota bacterium]
MAVLAIGEMRPESWLMPAPAEQLYREGLDDQKGMGRIFVPAMTNPNNEPFYAVFSGEELIGETMVGSSFFVPPGKYTVVLGSGTRDQRIAKEVEVRREETVVIEPDWCALTIEVIDESRNFFKQDLQIFRVLNAESFGILPAISPELGEQMQTLILPAGLYKIVKRGRDFNTFVNFATVLLEAGVYTPFTLVINSQNGDFTGAGILTRATELRQIKYMRVYAAIHGNVVVNSDNRSSRQTRTNLSVLTQFENRLMFDRFPHYYLSNNLLDFGTQKLHESKFTIKPDLLQLKNTYIYYLLTWLGGYTRLDLITHFLPTTVLFSDPKNIWLTESDSRFIKRKVGITEFNTAPSFYPLEIKEGLGVNLTPLRTFNARVSVRTGFGFRQSYNKDVYQPTSIDSIYRRVLDIHQRGLESSLVSYFNTLFNLSITTELDILFPFGQKKEPVVDLVNFISLALTKNVTLEHTLRFKHDRTLYTYNIVEQLISMRLSYYFL